MKLYQDFGKRAFDVIVSLAVLVLLLPLFILIAVAIKLDDQGPVFFRQVRVGKGGRQFRIYKFRSMRNLLAGGALITAASDSRITRCGKFLRRYKLDELPQFINVLFGQMSVVGPRPEVAKYIELYAAQQRKRILSVRPGLTDYAAIALRDEEHILAASSDPEATYVNELMPRKFALYDKYCNEIFLRTDIKIVVSTVINVWLKY